MIILNEHVFLIFINKLILFSIFIYKLFSQDPYLRLEHFFNVFGALSHKRIFRKM